MLPAGYREYTPEASPFPVIYTDLTHRCNMACSNCYVPNRTIPDMDKHKFYEFLHRLPRKTEIRLIGGEATTREDLPEIVAEVNSAGHTPILLTNGLRLKQREYAKELYASGLRRIYVSMNGADDDNVYLQTDHMKCASAKIAALHNCVDEGFHVGIGVILVKGISGEIPERIHRLIKGVSRPVHVSFRNVGDVGRNMTGTIENYTLSELISLVGKEFGATEEFIRRHSRTDFQFRFPVKMLPAGSEKSRLYWIKVTDWSTLPDSNISGRGRVTQDFKVAPFFQHVKKNEFAY